MLGRTVFNNNSIHPTRVSADGNPIYKPTGVLIDWSTVTAAPSDVTLPDGSIIRAGQKYLRYGQTITKKTPAEVDTLTITGSPTGGTFTVTVGGFTTPAIPYNASVATVQGFVQQLPSVGNNLVVVTGTPASSYVLSFAGILGPLTVTTAGSLTGGTSPAIAVARTSTGTTLAGAFGPYDPAANDGRQTLTRGSVYVLDETVLQYSSGSNMLSVSNDQIGGAIEGGLIYIDRILQAGTGTASLATGPTLANFLSTFPLFTLAQD